jgi:hypothetical protein
VLTLSTVLIGCGNISLSELLEKQVPGDIRITPETATIDTDSQIEIVGKGGFKPYTFSATAGSIDDIDGSTYYTAPNSATTVTITVVDSFSNQATALFDVVSATGLSFPDAITIAIGEPTGFLVASGGVPPYTFWVVGDGTLSYHAIHTDRVKYTPPGYATTEYLWIEDSDSPPTQRTLTITIE